jgi:hypothetical protein
MHLFKSKSYRRERQAKLISHLFSLSAHVSHQHKLPALPSEQDRKLIVSSVCIELNRVIPISVN